VIFHHRKGLKKISLFLSILILPFNIQAENTIDIGRLYFSLSPKIMEDGSIADLSIGINYKNYLGGEIRFRNTNVSKNEELQNVSDSLNAVTENALEFFLLPVNFNFKKDNGFKFWAGAGLYYKYNKLREKGFFNMPALETLTPPRERVNSYTNNFSMHQLGPLIDTGILYTSKLFNISFSGGIVPIFYLGSSQKVSIVPLLDPDNAEFSQNTSGSPYFYLNLDFVLFKYINLVFLYDYTKMDYRVIDFDENLSWITPERIVRTQSLKIETSVLLPLGGDMYGQVGYGYTFDYIRLDNANVVSSNRQYLILTVKKVGR